MKKIIGFLLVPPLLFPQVAYAHAFGQQYTLPVPLWLYLYGSAAVLIVSFLIIGYFLQLKRSSVSYPTHVFLQRRFLHGFLHPLFLAILQLLSVLLLLFTIVTGIFGTDEAISNFSMTYFWIILVLGVTYASAFLGNIWSFVNPWKILISWEESIRKQQVVGILSYPRWLSYYPALVFYFAYIWIELIGKITPHELGFILLGYTILSNIGAAVFGKEIWFTYCDFFSVLFRMVSRIAPFTVVNGTLVVRPPFIGLLAEQAEDFSLLLFILFMLASTAFDGFHATGVYRQFVFSSSVVDSISLFNFLLAFLGLYLFLLWCMKLLSKTKQSLWSLALQFAFSLVPIALAYNIAHYYTLLLIQGQSIISLVSDPFGIGWNLLGTARFTPNIALLSTGFIWNSQVAAIVLGHIAGVYLAHIEAVRVLPHRKILLLSQLPMLLLMIAYTMFGLWILSQPIVGS